MSLYLRRQKLRRMRRVHVVAALLSTAAVIGALYRYPNAAAAAAAVVGFLQLHSLEVIREILGQDEKVIPS